MQELEILKKVIDIDGFPHLKASKITKDFVVIITEILGPNVSKIF